MGLISRVSSRTYRIFFLNLQIMSRIRQYLSKSLLTRRSYSQNQNLHLHAHLSSPIYIQQQNLSTTPSNRIKLPPEIEILIRTAQTTGKALKKTFEEELNNPTKNIDDGKKKDSKKKTKEQEEEAKKLGVSETKKLMALSEAEKILNIELRPEMTENEVDNITKKYEKLYLGNGWVKRERNRPTYMQSKIFRAAERLHIEVDRNVKVIKEGENDDDN